MQIYVIYLVVCQVLKVKSSYWEGINNAVCWTGVQAKSKEKSQAL